MHKVLSTKKLEPLLLEKAREKGIEIIEKEFIKVSFLGNKKKFREIVKLAGRGIEHVVFTSANAVAALDQQMEVGGNYYSIDTKMFCLSGKTKESILKGSVIGKQIVGEAENASLLAKEIIDKGVKEVVFFCGNKRREELSKLLSEAGVKVHQVEVYETMEAPVKVNEDVEGVLFFSPSAVKSFFKVNELKEKIVCFAIGQTTADSIAEHTRNKVIVSEFPSQEQMLDIAAAYFKNNN